MILFQVFQGTMRLVAWIAPGLVGTVGKVILLLVVPIHNIDIFAVDGKDFSLAGLELPHLEKQTPVLLL